MRATSCGDAGSAEEKKKNRKTEQTGEKKEHKVLQLGYPRTLPKKILPLQLSGDCHSTPSFLTGKSAWTLALQ
jgi:hypothetical protein